MACAVAQADALAEELEQLQLFTYPTFPTYKPFTITFLANLTQGELNLSEIFKQLPVTDVDFKPVPGKRVKIDVTGRPGDILALKMKENGQLLVRGIDKGTRAFNNCINMVITVTDEHGRAEKNIDCKLFKDNIQSTGNTCLRHTEETWRHLKAYLSQMNNVANLPLAEIDLQPIEFKMYDITFSLDFMISRENFKAAIDKTHGFHVIWEAGVHTNGVSVKYPLEPFNGELVRGKRMPPCVTFIVFTTGKVICSGRSPTVMEPIYNLFRETVNALRPEIELKIRKR